MKFWLVSWNHNETGRMREWYRHKSDANDACRIYMEDDDCHNVEMDRVEVPTRGRELEDWLNETCGTDNG